MKHPIIEQAISDIKAAQKIWIPWRVLLPWMVLCLAGIVLCDHFGKSELALPLLMSIAVFGFFIYLKWGLRRQLLFWGTIAVLAALHALLILYIPWTSQRVPTAAIAGGASIDLCLMLWVFAFVEVLLRGQRKVKN